MVEVEIIPHEKKPWKKLGAFFCDRETMKEVGSPFYSAPGVTWFVALDGRKVVGFAALREDGKALWHDYGYVVPGRRGEGIFGTLAEVREEFAERSAKPRRIAVPEARWHHYELRGWAVRSKRGSWIYGERTP